MCIQDSALARMLVTNGSYYVFDPHINNIQSNPTENSTAVLLQSRSLAKLLMYLNTLGRQLTANYFECIPYKSRHNFDTCEIKQGFWQQGKNKIDESYDTYKCETLLDKHFSEQMRQQVSKGTTVTIKCQYNILKNIWKINKIWW